MSGLLNRDYILVSCFIYTNLFCKSFISFLFFCLESLDHDVLITAAWPLKSCIDPHTSSWLNLDTCKKLFFHLQHMQWYRSSSVCVARCWSRRRTWGKDFPIQHTSWSCCRVSSTPRGSTWRPNCVELKRSWTSLLTNYAGGNSLHTIHDWKYNECCGIQRWKYKEFSVDINNYGEHIIWRKQVQLDRF